jgi:hypothetical protein
MDFGGRYFQEFSNVFTKEQHSKILNTLAQRRWSFDNWAEHEKDKGILCWSLWGLEEETFYNTELLQRINQLTGNSYRAERIYANGQSFGQDGVFHIDHKDPNAKAYTFLYYPTEIDPLEVYEFGGETQFIQSDGDLYHVYPFTNTAVIFDALIWHRGMGPNKWSKQLRTSVAFKLIQID